jgi:hypothetical protein
VFTRFQAREMQPEGARERYTEAATIRSYRGGVSLGACSSSKFQGQGPNIIVGRKPVHTHVCSELYVEWRSRGGA